MTNSAESEPTEVVPQHSRREFLSSAAVVAGTAAGLWGTATGAARAADSAQSVPCPQHRTPMKDVSGKVAFITGGSHGIGLGIARAFLSAGMKVVITYQTKSHVDEAMRQMSGAADRVHAIELNVTDRTRMERAAEETVQRFGKIHVLVNNAGLGSLVPLASAKYAEWDEAWNINVNGIFNGVHAFLPKIQAQGEGGQIVTTASTAGLVAGPVGIYSTTKFAVVGMMEALRQELLDTNIGVSVFCPGAVNTNPVVVSADGSKGVSTESAPGLGVNGMDPLEAGEWVLRGIRANNMFILSHPEFEQGIKDRNEALLASIPRVTAPAARIAQEAPILRSTIYIQERDRLICERQRS
jgi:NAD(P)-dependent dehydrogenase (short-subunit alcohol dehydrogenase family)